MTTDQQSALKFIIDEPAKVDFFNTHSPVASAISKSIITNPTLKIIGLVGRWGSGKSTIVREVSEKIHRQDSSYLSFNYDAWLHQNDPLRRSFLESLVQFLIANKSINKEVWDKKLALLSGSIRTERKYETPLFTSEAKLFALCALLVPIGLSLLGRETFEDALGSSYTRAGWTTFVLGVSLIFIPSITWGLRTLWLKFRGKEANFFPPILLNRNFTHTNTQIQKSIEPTSIEFGHEFRSLMKEVYGKNIKLVIIIDNIDRIAEEEAMNIWANIRSFFLSSSDDNNIVSENYHPVVILPVDSKSIAQMFSIGSSSIDGERLASSFINKTFDVTFYVPAPVMSDWKEYFKEKMKFCLGNLFTEERYFRSRQFLEYWFDTTKTSITPREINKCLNRMVALLIQYDDSPISFESIAYFSINRNHIERDILKFVADGNNILSNIAPNWAREISALHFGVDVEHAAQVLMTAPIQRAILRGDSEPLKPYIKISGFGDTFESVTSNLPSEELRPAPNFEVITNAALILSELEETGVWQAFAWRNLIRAFMIASGEVLLSRLTERMDALFLHVDPADALDFARSVEAFIDELISASDISTEQMKETGALADKLIEFSSNRGFRPPIFDLDGPAAVYLNRLAMLSSLPVVQKRIRSGVSHAELRKELVGRVSSADTAGDVAGLMSLLTSDAANSIIKKPLTEANQVIDAAEQVVRSEPGNSTLFSSAMRVLVSPNGMDDHCKESLGRLVQDGTLTSKLNQLAEQNDSRALAAALTAIIWKRIDTPSPVGSSWASTFEKFPLLELHVNAILDARFDPDIPIDLLFHAYNSCYRLHDLITPIFEGRVKRKKLGRLSPARILGNLSEYARIINWRLRDDFAKQLSGYQSFWPNVKSLPWSDSIFEAASLLKRRGGEAAERMESELIDRLQKAPVEEWVVAIEEGTEPFRIVTKLIDKTALKLGVGSPLLEALTSSVSGPAILAKQGHMRWFDLAEFLTTPARKQAMEAISVALLKKEPSNMLKILKAGGERLINEGSFLKQPDVVIEQLIIPLARSKQGRIWLRDRQQFAKSIAVRGTDASLPKLRKLVFDFARSNDEDKRHWAQTTGNQFA